MYASKLNFLFFSRDSLSLPHSPEYKHPLCMSSLSLTRKTQFKMYQKWYFGSLFRWKCFMNENPKANPTPN